MAGYNRCIMINSVKLQPSIKVGLTATIIVRRFSIRHLSLLVLGLVLLAFVGPALQPLGNGGTALAAPPGQEQPNDPQAPLATITRRVNAPFFPDALRAYEMAVFWFGRVNSSENYADVRVGYTREALVIRVSIMDRLLWHDESPTAAELTNYDAVSLYLGLDGNTGTSVNARNYRFVAMESSTATNTSAQAAHTGVGSGWNIAAVPFTAASGWRGDARNNTINDRGWSQEFTIRFTDLGLSGPPASGSVWGLALQLHDRDAANGDPNPVKTWPESLNTSQPASWGQLGFGLPTYTPPAVAPRGSVTIRQGLNGAQVADTAVGGTIGRLCPGDPDYIWNRWGDANFAGAPRFNLQNQADIADWPCFAKYYVTFPLDSVPAGSQVLSATLTFHQFGGSDPTQAQRSLIQVFSLAETWSEATLTWNNAPLALENVSQGWADVVDRCDWPCETRQFDVSRAAAQALSASQSLNLALYEADTAYHSGKYFLASEEPDWNAVARPTLTVVWSDSAGVLTKTASPLTPRRGETVAYRLTFTGTGSALTLSDQLPVGLSAPLGLSASIGSLQYDNNSRTLTWTGSPAQSQEVVINYSVTIQTSAVQVLVNSATLQGSPQASSASAIIIANGSSINIPITIK